MIPIAVMLHCGIPQYGHFQRTKRLGFSLILGPKKEWRERTSSRHAFSVGFREGTRAIREIGDRVLIYDEIVSALGLVVRHAVSHPCVRSSPVSG